eukprot:7153482-Pyramimonas_sp.AAC.1
MEIQAHKRMLTCRYVLTADQSDARSVGIFSRRTNQTQEEWVISLHNGSSCANNGKGALNTPDTLPLFSTRI